MNDMASTLSSAEAIWLGVLARMLGPIAPSAVVPWHEAQPTPPAVLWNISSPMDTGAVFPGGAVARGAAGPAAAVDPIIWSFFWNALPWSPLVSERSSPVQSGL